MILGFCLFASILTNSFAAKDDKDWTFDPKTSTLIPKYLGKIKAMSGKVIIGERELKKGSKIYNNDLIQTGEKSYAVLDLIDLTTITLGPSSDFKVENWSYRTKNDREVLFNVLKGQWRALVRSKSKDADQLKIKTPIVSLGIRGTELMVNVLNEGGSDVTQVALLEGSVHMEGDRPELKKDLVPGDHEIIAKNEAGLKQKSKKMSAEEMKSYQESIAPDVLRLLERARIEELGIQASNAPQSENTTTTHPDNSNQTNQPSEKETKTSKSVRENLQILNALREENRKKK
ncbi:MAG: FecR family protein [Bacteriovorax sp.]